MSVAIMVILSEPCTQNHKFEATSGSVKSTGDIPWGLWMCLQHSCQSILSCWSMAFWTWDQPWAMQLIEWVTEWLKMIWWQISLPCGYNIVCQNHTFLMCISSLYIIDMYHFVQLLQFGSTKSSHSAWRGQQVSTARSHEWWQWKRP